MAKWNASAKAYARSYRRDHPEFGHWVNAKARAKRKGLAFTVTRQDILDVMGETCPVFGMELRANEGTKRKSHSSPSLDRIDPRKGYVPGNIQIISDKANTMKQDATPEELLQFADWIYATFGKVT